MIERERDINNENICTVENVRFSNVFFSVSVGAVAVLVVTSLEFSSSIPFWLCLRQSSPLLWMYEAARATLYLCVRVYIYTLVCPHSSRKIFFVSHNGRGRQRHWNGMLNMFILLLYKSYVLSFSCFPLRWSMRRRFVLFSRVFLLSGDSVFYTDSLCVILLQTLFFLLSLFTYLTLTFAYILRLWLMRACVFLVKTRLHQSNLQGYNKTIMIRTTIV